MNIRIHKSIQKIIVLPTEDQPSTTLYKKTARKKKKGSFGLRVLEKVVRRNAKSDVAGIETYLQRHERSNRKKRDGWLIDLGYNTYKAQLKKAKRLIDL